MKMNAETTRPQEQGNTEDLQANKTHLPGFSGAWQPKLMGQIGLTYGGLSGKSKSDFGRGTARYVTFLNVLEHVIIDLDLLENVFVSPSETQNRVLSGDLLFNGTSETPGDLAMGAVVQADIPDLYLNSFCFGFRIHDPSSYDAQFLAYFFRGPIGRRIMYALAQGATRYNMSKQKFLELEINIPKYAEQRAIAEVLSDVDGLIQSLDALIAKKRAIKQAVMQQLLTGKTRLPGFSGAWETKRLGEIGPFSKGRGIKRDDVSDEGVPCIRYGELYTRYKDQVLNPVGRIPLTVASKSLPIKTGDLLFAGSGETSEEIGRCAAYLGEDQVYVGGDIVVLTPLSQNSLYLGYLMNHPTVARQKARMAQGDAVVHINSRNLAQVQIDLPTLTEQRAIATILSDMDAEIAALERRRDKTRDIKQGMMQQLLTGRIRLVKSK